MLKIRDFEWDEHNIEHIARHHVYPDEAEEACKNNPVILRGRQGYHILHGRTNSGRYLFIVGLYLGNGLLRVATARDMDETEKRLYHRKK